jgi:effector-binding domain-containing protein
MKKKRLLITIFCLLLIALGIFLLSFVSFSVEKEIRISSPIYYVATQYTNLKNWKNWHPTLLNKDSALFSYSGEPTQVNSFLRTPEGDYTIVKADPASIMMREDRDGKKTYHTLSAFPDSFGMATKVRWTAYLSTFDWLRLKNNVSSQLQEGLNNMKMFSEDVKNRYGFRIEIHPMADSIIAFKEINVAKEHKLMALRKLYDEVSRYGQLHHIDMTGPRIATYYTVSLDTLHIVAGISVKNKGPEMEGIRFTEIPKQGRDVVAYYQGAYDGVRKMYAPMEQFVTDRNLRKVATPFEKYYGNPISSADSANMRIELCYPVL